MRPSTPPSCVDEEIPGIELQHVIVGSASDLEARVAGRLPDAVAVAVPGGPASLAAARNARVPTRPTARTWPSSSADAFPEHRWLGGLLDAVRGRRELSRSRRARCSTTTAPSRTRTPRSRLPVSRSCRGPGKPDSGGATRPFDVLYPSPWAFVVETKAFRWVGGFDAELTPGVEHVDLGWRLWIAGLRVVLAPDSVLRLAPEPRVRASTGAAGARRARDALQELREESLSRAVAAALTLADDEVDAGVPRRAPGVRGRPHVGAGAPSCARLGDPPAVPPAHRGRNDRRRCGGCGAPDARHRRDLHEPASSARGDSRRAPVDDGRPRDPCVADGPGPGPRARRAARDDRALRPHATRTSSCVTSVTRTSRVWSPGPTS